MQFLRVLTRKVGRVDQPGLQQPRDERARPRERVEDVHALVAERRPEMLTQQLRHRADDEIHDLDRRVDDAKTLGVAGERPAEEVVVELDRHALAALGVVDALDAAADTRVEAGQRLRLRLQPPTLQFVHHPLHDLADGVQGSEVRAAEQRVEDRPGDQVLREHRRRVVLADRVVEIVAQRRDELTEALAGTAGRGDQGADALVVAASDVGDGLGPLLPVAPLAAALDDLRVDRLAPLFDTLIQSSEHVLRDDLGGGVAPGAGAVRTTQLPAFLRRLARADADDGDGSPVAAAVEVEFVDPGIEAFVVRAQRLQHLPDVRVGVVAVE